MALRVLVVDDDRAHRRSIARSLSRAGHQVETAEDGTVALSLVHRFDPDVVISDIRMPGVGGIELLSKLQADAPDVHVILVTAYHELQSAIQAMQKGAYDYLLKPIDLDELDSVMEQIERERAPEEARDWIAMEPPAEGVLIGRHRRIVEVCKMIGKVSSTRAPVLIRGETGTGKELVARTIHRNSLRAEEPFVSVNCAALPEPLLESELFGHVKGAFTGAVSDRRGRFELAGAGTILLDEIGDTGPALQAKLLRVLEEEEFFPVGGERPKPMLARVLAATHRPIEAMIPDGRFRKDLYFRLRVVEIVLPPLRERRSDIPRLVHALLQRTCGELDVPVPSVSEPVLSALMSYAWPGNIRELENTLTRAAVLAQGHPMTVEMLGLGRVGTGGAGGAPVEPGEHGSLEDMEREYVQEVLLSTGGHQVRTAEILGISRNRLARMIKKWDLVVKPDRGE